MFTNTVRVPVRKIVIDPVYLTVVFIRSVRRNHAIGTATGFFWSRNQELFLGTNRHVVIDEQKGYYPDSLNIVLHKTENDLTTLEEVTVPLYNEDKPAWLEHPDARVDLVLTRIPDEWRQKYYINSFDATWCFPADEDIGVAPPGFVVGFPEGLFDDQACLPIVRSATLASAFRAPFKGAPMMLFDADLHPGTSGSPVIWQMPRLHRVVIVTKPSKIKRSTYLLGINSAMWPFKSKPSNLCVVWFAEELGRINQVGTLR